MRFPMRNCLKYIQQCQNGIFKKICRATTVTYSVIHVDLPSIFTHIESMGNPLIPEAEKHALQPFTS